MLQKRFILHVTTVYLQLVFNVVIFWQDFCNILKKIKFYMLPRGLGLQGQQ